MMGILEKELYFRILELGIEIVPIAVPIQRE
jgi:hypothetical protein